jgi:plastocyanin
MNKNYLFIGVIITVLVVAVSGCTSSQNRVGYTVNIQNMAFNPSIVYIQVGTTVFWTNKDLTTHRVVSDTGLFDSGNLTNGQSYNYTFNQPGNYSYHCAIHPSMTGSIVAFAMTNGTGSPMTTQTSPNNPAPASTGGSNSNPTSTGIGGIGY